MTQDKKIRKLRLERLLYKTMLKQSNLRHKMRDYYTKYVNIQGYPTFGTPMDAMKIEDLIYFDLISKLTKLIEDLNK